MMLVSARKLVRKEILFAGFSRRKSFGLGVMDRKSKVDDINIITETIAA